MQIPRPSVSRVLAVFAVLILLSTACAGGDEVEETTSTSSERPAPTEATTTTPAVQTTTTVAETTTTTTEPPPARTVEELLALGRPVNLSHAGGDQSFPHSTMFAFREGVLAGADALEMDVQLTGDGVLIVQHDDTVDRTTNSTGPVADLTLEEIQALDNAYWFSPKCWRCDDLPEDDYIYRGIRTGDLPPPDGYDADDFRVETFRSVAEAFPDLVLDIEIKGEYPDALPVVEELAAEIDELDRTDSVVVVSFDDDLLDAFHELAPDVVLSPGRDRLTEWFLETAELEPYFEILQVPPFEGEIEVVTPETVQRVHDEGRFVWVWADDASTQENTEFYRRMLDDGVDGFIAGRPAEMTEALDG